MPEAKVGRPRDAQVHHAILEATRELLVASSYAELSMEGIAARAKVQKKTLYLRWPSKAPLVAEAVLDAYTQTRSHRIPDTGDVRADLRSWLVEHAEFHADARNAAMVRALIAAVAASSIDPQDIGQIKQFPFRERAALDTRLRHAIDSGLLHPHTDLDVIANAIMGMLVLQVLTHRTPAEAIYQFDGLLDAILGRAINT
jgi:AcrR family transcriptional regulator